MGRGHERHGKAISMIQNEMEGRSLRPLLHSLVPSRDVASATITNSDHASMFYLVR